MAACVLLAVALVVAAVFNNFSYTWNWEPMAKYKGAYIDGWVRTVLVSLAALVVSLGVGVGLAAAQMSRSRVLQWTARGYVELIRGTPLLVQILIGFYVVAPAVGLSDEFWVGVLLLSVFSGAYLAEILRGGVESVSASQRQAAAAVGFSGWQSFRFVVWPQALRRVLPAVTGRLVSLLKDSSLLSVISVREFTYVAKTTNAATYNSLESFIPLAIGYLIMTLPLAGVAAWLERWLAYEE